MFEVVEGFRLRSEEYLAKLREKFDENGHATCDSCGGSIDIGHGIVDHRDNSVQLICNSCYFSQYVLSLYGISPN